MNFIGLNRMRPGEKIMWNTPDYYLGVLFVDMKLDYYGVVFFEEDSKDEVTIYTCEHIDIIDTFKKYYEYHIKKPDELYSMIDIVDDNYAKSQDANLTGKELSHIILHKFLSKFDSIVHDNPEWRKLLIKEKIINATYVNNLIEKLINNPF